MCNLLCVTEVFFLRKHLDFTWPAVLVQNIYDAMLENISILTSNFEACLPFANFEVIIHFNKSFCTTRYVTKQCISGLLSIKLWVRNCSTRTQWRIQEFKNRGEGGSRLGKILGFWRLVLMLFHTYTLFYCDVREQSTYFKHCLMAMYN